MDVLGTLQTTVKPIKAWTNNKLKNKTDSNIYSPEEYSAG